MKNSLIVLGIIFLLSVSSNVLAQGFTFHGTIAFPQTDFKVEEVDNDNAGFAKIGFGGGIEFLSSELGKKFYWIGSLNFIHHGVRDELFEKFDAYDINVTANNNGDIDLTAYNCIALTTGVRFKNMFDRKKKEFGLYLDGQIGMSLIYGPDYKYVSDDGSIEETLTWDLANSFVFSIGAGFIMWSKVLIGVKYVNMLTPEFGGVLESNDGLGSLIEENVKFSQSISTISINLGFTFQNK